MKLGSMLGDVVTSFFKKPVTQMYPFERLNAPDNLRGRLYYDPSKCSGCQLCIKDCPANALELITIDKTAKRFVMKYHIDRCTFCDQCVQSCRFKCLNLSDEQWEMASLRREPFVVYYGKEEDVNFLLEKAAQPDTGQPCE